MTHFPPFLSYICIYAHAFSRHILSEALYRLNNEILKALFLITLLQSPAALTSSTSNLSLAKSGGVYIRCAFLSKVFNHVISDVYFEVTALK